MADSSSHVGAIREALRQRILVLDGAMGTALQVLNLTDADFGGEHLHGCNEMLVLRRPQIVQEIHEAYLKAGADIVETNTFGATPLVLSEYGLADQARTINMEGARLARTAAKKYSTPDKPRFVAGSMGPTTRAITVTGGITFDELRNAFRVQAESLIHGGVDYLLIETCQDTRNIKACVLGIEDAFVTQKSVLPIAVSGTIEATGTMLAGQTVEALCTSLAHLDLLYLGLNCATGPSEMAGHVRRLAAASRFPLACVPNAGFPDEDGNYLETPSMVASVIHEFAEKGWLNLVGGCCGTTPAHVAAIAEAVSGVCPRECTGARVGGSFLSGIVNLEVSDNGRPYVVGERTNVIGSRKFKKLMKDGALDEAAELAKTQERAGATVIDVCLSDPERDEIADIHTFFGEVVKRIKAPLMIDSTDADATEVALTYSQGKAIINSINLEDGLERFERVVPLAKRYGAALVVGCIDEDPEQGMAVTRDRKLAVAVRSHELLVNNFGFPEEDIYFDPLVFPCATGDENYVGSAIETIEGIRLIKERFSNCRTVLGISNVSFGLPTAGREILNSVFLHHCVEAGLDLAIVNAEKVVEYDELSSEEIKLCEDLLWTRGDDPIAAFAAHFRKKKKVKKKSENLPLDERLANFIIDGSKDGLVRALDEKLKEAPPLEIVNGPLMAGMAEVGRLFNKNRLIVAEVLQSAEAMKAAVGHLEQFMPKNETSTKGRMLLATVKGDVHDIGKNLVDIIFTNNGFEVINLGIKVSPEALIAAANEHSPDMIGLSGLLVKSAQQMVITAAELSSAGVTVPVLVGGAALTERFADLRIAPAHAGLVLYAKDAMSGLDLAQKLVDPDCREEMIETVRSRQKTVLSDVPVAQTPTVMSTRRSPAVQLVRPVAPPDLERHVIVNTPVEQMWKYLNLPMLFTKNLGFRGSFVKALERGDEKAVELNAKMVEVKELYRAVTQPKAVMQFFRAASDGNTLSVYDPSGGFLCDFDFPRQDHGDSLCLADYFLPDQGKGPEDFIGMLVVSAGEGIAELATKLKDDGEYLKSHMIQALAMGTAEAYAEHVHALMRGRWGFPDPVDLDLRDIFAAKYQGTRYSFGYPACPEMEGQELMWQLLKPGEIGCRLTDGHMMEPEASVSALVTQHPQSTYFSIRKG